MRMFDGFGETERVGGWFREGEPTFAKKKPISLIFKQKENCLHKHKNELTRFYMLDFALFVKYLHDKDVVSKTFVLVLVPIIQNLWHWG